MSKLFQPLKVGRITLKQRIAMAPMTRNRADANFVPTPSVVEYYKQRAQAPGTLLITEGTVISPRHGGYPNVPGIYNDTQQKAWKGVVDAVHAQGSYIYLQLWALGRAANPQFMKAAGFDLLSASDVPMTSPFSGETHQPRPLTEEEIHGTIAEYAAAAKRAIAAGFDGVELHGAFGYLIDEFTQDVSNKRTDKWGGSVENRSRFAVEATKAVVDAVGAENTAFRISPWNRYQGMGMDNPRPQFLDLVGKLAKFKLAYLHIFESDVKAEKPEEDIKFLIDAYGDASPVFVVNGYDGEKAIKAVDEEYADHDNIGVAFGRPFISNPDLVAKIKHHKPLAPSNRETYYSNDDEGYIDYRSTEKL